MKNLVNFLMMTMISTSLLAQSITVDKEKLLEFYQTQRYAEAATYLQSIYPADTQDVKALSQIAYCYMMSGKLSDAETSYLKINELQPNTLPILFSLANINSKRGNDAKAKFYLASIIAIDTLNFNAFKRLADLADSSSQKLQYLKKANGLNNTEADVALDLSDAYYELKQFAPAYQALKIAIAADTGNFILQRAQLPILIEMKKYKEAVAIGEKLLTDDEDPKVIKEVAKAHYFIKNYQKAIDYFKKLEKLALQNELTLYYTTLSYRELKNYDMAVIYAKKTIEEGISPNTSTYYAMLGSLYETKEQFTSSSTAYKRGITFNASSNLYYRLGLLYDLKLNDKKNALNYYNLYLKSKPKEIEKEQIDYTKSRILVLNMKEAK